LIKRVYTHSKLGVERTEGTGLKGNCTAKLAQIGEAAASVVRGKEEKMEYTEHTVARGLYWIYAREYAGEEPAIVLMHGFPDNLHLYDRLIPQLSGRRVVVFDFLGWGRSDKPEGYPYTADNQTRDLDAVIHHLGLENLMLVAHDASGPPAIDWTLAHHERVSALVLLNTYYNAMKTLRPPEAILLFSAPILRNIARTVIRRSDYLDRKVYSWQVGRFIRDEEVKNEVVPFLYSQFREARPAFWALNEDLLWTVLSRREMIPKMRSFARPVRIIFGDADPYLNRGVARRFHELFPTSELFLLPDARHYVQIDEPEEVARLILSTPLPGRMGSLTGTST
jgi:haloalkane dehalogenase